MKKKILTIAIFSVMVLTVIGLAVGLVLVAGRASMNNVMQISYVSNNVGARITAYGILYPNATGTENGVTIPTADGNDSETVEFYEDQEDANGNISFQTVDVTATSRAVYTFNITNTVSSTNTKELKALFAFNNLNDSDNVIIQVGTSESNATTISSTYNQYYINIGAGQQYKTIVVTMRVADPEKDLKDFVANMQITLDYDIEDTTPFNWGTETGDYIIGVDNRSSASFDMYALNVASGERKVTAGSITYNYTDQYPDAISIGLNFTPTKSTNYNITVTIISPDGKTYTASDTLNATTKCFENCTYTQHYSVEIQLLSHTYIKLDCSHFASMGSESDWPDSANGTKILIEITDAE